jgi:hypothetical protein
MSEDYHISFASLYESKYYKDFARRNLKELLGQHGLRVVKEAYELINFIEILVCEVAGQGEREKRRMI